MTRKCWAISLRSCVRVAPFRVAPQLLAFGEGPHRCPGGPLAMRETEVLLAAMLRRPDLEVLSNPEFGRNESVKGYEVRHLRLRLGHAGC